jgi:DNA gyrase subunit B
VTGDTYGPESIKVLSLADAVRRRPGMYIGDATEGSALHRMLYVVVENAVDEALAGHCSRIDVTLYADGSVSVLDDGRGVPTEVLPRLGISAVQIIMTRMRAAGACSPKPYHSPDGGHSVGVMVVNFLSLWLEVTVWRDGKEHFMRFLKGAPENGEDLRVVGDAPVVANGEPKRGTFVRFLPSPQAFTGVTEISRLTVAARLRDYARLAPGVRIALRDKRGAEPYRAAWIA